jgi:riboflavin transporter FmnP
MNNKASQLVKGSLFLALGLIMPYIFHMTGIAGQVFLPMHIPVLLCGLLLGERYGFIVGIITPLLNSLLTGMPPIFPTGVAMMLELGVYGFISGYLYKKRKLNIFISLIAAMLLGRVISGVSNYIFLSMAGKNYMLEAFVTSSFVTPVWGIIIQLVLIPAVVKLAGKGKGMMP